MSYIETGQGDPIVLLHGNPTSSYIWRNVIPLIESKGRCIAPDLIGMGDSDKLRNSDTNSYGFFEHREYLDALLAALDIRENIVFVLHDWGSALGFDWANRHRDSVSGIAYMEAIVRPARWEEMRDPFKSFLKTIRSPAGEEMILERNLFVEELLPQMINRELTDTEMAVYRRPYLEPGESRRPTLSWPRQIVLDGNPLDVAEVIQSYADWLPTSEIPKLLINANPGSILVGSRREFCRSWRNQTETTVEGRHFVQEDSPEPIGSAIALWLEDIRGQT